MTDSAPNNPVLTFEGKRYDLNTLPDELKELVRGMHLLRRQVLYPAELCDQSKI